MHQTSRILSQCGPGKAKRQKPGRLRQPAAAVFPHRRPASSRLSSNPITATARLDHGKPAFVPPVPQSPLMMLHGDASVRCALASRQQPPCPQAPETRLAISKLPSNLTSSALYSVKVFTSSNPALATETPADASDAATTNPQSCPPG